VKSSVTESQLINNAAYLRYAPPSSGSWWLTSICRDKGGRREGVYAHVNARIVPDDSLRRESEGCMLRSEERHFIPQSCRVIIKNGFT
jgi:hypothetical protein